MSIALIIAAMATLPALNLAGVGNSDVALASLRGRPAVVQFWASWCTSCGGVGRELAAIVGEIPGETPFLAVSADETLDAARAGVEAQRRTAVRGKTYYFDRGHELAAALGDVAIPTVLVIGADGQVLARVTGHFGEAQRGEIRTALKRAQKRP